MKPSAPSPKSRRFRARLGRLLSVGFWILTAGLVAGNLRLYSEPAVTADFHRVPPHAEAQLHWLRGELETGAGERMQALFPEGYFFSHLLYGLSWVELALRDSGRVGRALEEARWSLERIESEAGKAPFPPRLPPDHGMFYSAWRNHLLSGILLVQPEGGRDRKELALFEARCAALAETLAGSSTPFPPSYTRQAWPCDTPPAIHSLRVREAIVRDGKYDAIIADWLVRAKQHLDPGTGLLPHTADWRTGEPTGPARGTSQVIIQRFLADIDPAWAAEQYEAFRCQYFDHLVGVPAIREFPMGTQGRGDVDSGPLVFGISGSATVVGMGVAGIYEDHEWARAVSQAGEALGLPFGREDRRYLGGVLPVGDAFLVHASTARPWLATTTVNVTPLESSSDWRWRLHGLSVIAWLAGWGLYRGVLRRFELAGRGRHRNET